VKAHSEEPACSGGSQRRERYVNHTLRANFWAGRVGVRFKDGRKKEMVPEKRYRCKLWFERVAIIATSVVAATILTSCSRQHATTSARPQFSELSYQDRVRLDAQRAVVATAVKQRYGVSALTKTTADMPVLQRLIDDRTFNKRQTYELQSLGVAFGDVLSTELPLRWVIVTDEYGADPTLRFKSTTMQINALTMISKRIERDEAVKLDELLRITREQLKLFAKAAEETQDPPSRPSVGHRPRDWICAVLNCWEHSHIARAHL
jgi:Domain of unknown function (DUF3806)